MSINTKCIYRLNAASIHPSVHPPPQSSFSVFNSSIYLPANPNPVSTNNHTLHTNHIAPPYHTLLNYRPPKPTLLLNPTLLPNQTLMPNTPLLNSLILPLLPRMSTATVTSMSHPTSLMSFQVRNLPSAHSSASKTAQFDSTGMFHWCPPQTIDSCIIVGYK